MFFFFFFRIKLKGNYIIIVLFFEIFHTFSNSVPFSETNKSFANFFFYLLMSDMTNRLKLKTA